MVVNLYEQEVSVSIKSLGDSNLADFATAKYVDKVTPRSVSSLAGGWARYTQIDLPLLSLGPSMRTNGPMLFLSTHMIV
uniref:Uncharacterized protein n=1 Tax=Helianthus annuus TaxID=4232 RepID=A0A251VF96_HELAN